MTKNKFYITTAIDYVNAAPHIGHAFEKVIADVLARWHRLLNKDVFFLTGTDENAQKNAQAAKEKKVKTEDFVDKNSKLFKELCKSLNISYDRFIRTTEKEHVIKSQELFKIAYDHGDIYKGKYEGYYCDGCEAFKTEKELTNGLCSEHNKKPRWTSEETYFFRMSKYKEQIIEFIQTYIVPEKRKNEILSRLREEELKDLSVTRSNIEWGIECPIDDKQKIYVWFDALINYISGSSGYWPADVHVIGKDINWFHSVIWPAMLFSTKQPLPKKLLVHGFLNLGGMKISKSLGNTIDPLELISKYGVDSLRYSLSRCSVFEDSDFSEEILKERHNNELGNKLGNLVSRVSALAEKYGLEKTEIKHLDSQKTLKNTSHFLENYELDKAIAEIFSFIDKINEFIQKEKPWETKNKEVLYELSNAIKDSAILLSPFIPETADKISKIFNFEISLKSINSPLKISKIAKADILFKRI